MAVTPPAPSASPHQALYRRWRAQTFSQIVGQSAAVTTLRNAVRMDRLAHAFLFVGPRGTGKTSMARILAKAVNCTDLRDAEPCDVCPSCVAIREGRAFDVVELDAASNNRVDDMRELLPRVYTAASDLRRKVFIIDEVQRIKEGWDVLLKTLEEPPDSVLFIFCTTDPSQIRPAVVSRLQRFTFRPLTPEEIAGKLRRILEADGRSADDDALALIARLAAGGMRDAESMLDQVLASGDARLTARDVRDLLGLADVTAVERFVDAFVTGDALAGIALLDALEAEGRDLVAFADQVVARLREAIVERLTARAGTDAARRVSPARLAEAARRLNGLDATRGGPGGFRWQLELALLGSIGDPPASAPEMPAAAAREAATPLAREAPAPSAPPAPAPTAPPPALRETAREAPATGPAAAEDEAPAGAPAAAPAAAAEHETPAVAHEAPAAATAPAHEAVAVPVAEGAPAAIATAARHEVVPQAPPASARAVDPSTASAAAHAASSDELLEQVRRGWPEVVAHVARNPANRPLIMACRPVEVRDGIIVLGFPEDQAFLRDIAERKRSALEEGLRQVLGRTIGVRCVATNVELVEPPAAVADDLVEQARRVFAGDLVDVADVT